jgi:hypothetical protein
MDLFSRTCLDLGSSFILIKRDWLDYQLYRLAPLRIIFAAVFYYWLVSEVCQRFQKKNGSLLRWLRCLGLLSGFSFAIAQTEIDSSVTSILNFDAAKHLGFGCISFGVVLKEDRFGVFNWLLGSLLLVFNGAMNHPNQNYYYAILVIIASICYAVNVNLIKSFVRLESS